MRSLPLPKSIAPFVDKNTSKLHYPNQMKWNEQQAHFEIFTIRRKQNSSVGRICNISLKSMLTSTTIDPWQ